MSVSVRISSRLRHLTGGSETFTVDAASLGELISKITAQHPRFGKEVLGPHGQIVSYINVSVGDNLVHDANQNLADGCNVEFYMQPSGG